MKLLIIDEALRQGYTIDTTCYPHYGYKGSRFDPDADVVHCLTEREAALVAALQRMQRMHRLMMDKVNHGASFYDAECLREMNEAPLQAWEALRDAGVEEAKP